MLIKEKNAHKSLRRPWLRIREILARSAMLRGMAVFAVSMVTIIFLTVVAIRTGFMASVTRIIFSKNYMMIPANYLKGLFTASEHIDIHIKAKNIKKLAYDRYVALNKGYLLSEDRHDVPALIRYKNKMLIAKLRLKGNMPDHWSGERWSFRIKIKEEGAILGMKQFSIQHPGTRGGLNEWYYKKLLEYHGLIYQRYDFIDVNINGKPMGIYAIEEHFGKALVEYNKLSKEGPILYFNDDYLWLSMVHSGKGAGFYDYAQEAYWSADIDGYISSDVKKDRIFMRNFTKAMDMLESFRTGKAAPGDVFDIESTAKLFAIAELCGFTHSHEYPNVKFYYNPITSRLEPVGSDVGGIKAIDHITGSAEKDKREIFFSTWEKLMFKDVAFFKEYVKALENISQASYLDNFFKKTSREADQKLAILHKSYPWYDFTEKPILYKNQRFIRNVLNPSKGIRVYLKEPIVEDGKIDLVIGNIQTMPIEILGVAYKDYLFLPAGDAVLSGKNKSVPVDYKTVGFNIQGAVEPSAITVKDISVKYRIPGSSYIKYETVSTWPYSSIGAATAPDNTTQKPNVRDFNFIVVDEDAKNIIFKSGEWAIKNDLIIPEGYQVIVGEGIRLELSNSASIISRSPISFLGSEERPIRIYSDDSTGQGLAVICAKGRSILRYVYFDNLSNPRKDGFVLEGAVTFYESPVNISNCLFANNRGGDEYLNIIRTNFNIERTVFKNAEFDACDGDFATGKITGSSFINSGNDAIDLDGSIVNIDHIFIDKAVDRALNIGRESVVAAHSVDIKNSKIAAASHDSSELVLDDLNITDCKQAFTVYQKKDEFGPSSMKVTGAVMKHVNIPYVVQAGSALVVDGKNIAAKARETSAYADYYKTKL